ncbi:hypothetical protein GCM10011369_32060 [Neiella marina]|uniref:Uncharacterized protein n=1 Tax=Neiella marina TaxID=508461 RepID=A0A8J2XR47_9GAMM|nr:hypothetical protein GCM10011369_32060 [Neiella marina]
MTNTYITKKHGVLLRNPPISNVAVNKKIVTYTNSDGKHKIELDSYSQKNSFINWLIP